MQDCRLAHIGSKQSTSLQPGPTCRWCHYLADSRKSTVVRVTVQSGLLQPGKTIAGIDSQPESLQAIQARYLLWKTDGKQAGQFVLTAVSAALAGTLLK